MQPVGLPGDDRVARGGSWNNNQDNARAAFRNRNYPNNWNNNIGFRCGGAVPLLTNHQVRAPLHRLPGEAAAEISLTRMRG